MNTALMENVSFLFPISRDGNSKAVKSTVNS